MKLLRILNSLGLNLFTGVSKPISIDDIEDMSGKRITGNGSTIRRDNKPWLFFNFENIKNGNKIEAIRFDGYKTRRELIGELDSQIKSSSKRITLEKAKIDDREVEKHSLVAGGKLSDIMYSYDDALDFI